MDCHDDFSNMQPEELRAKAAELRAQGNAYQEHADQLRALGQMRLRAEARGWSHDPDLSSQEDFEKMRKVAQCPDGIWGTYLPAGDGKYIATRYARKKHAEVWRAEGSAEAEEFYQFGLANGWAENPEATVEQLMEKGRKNDD